jgi:hypothetical protein
LRLATEEIKRPEPTLLAGSDDQIQAAGEIVHELVDGVEARKHFDDIGASICVLLREDGAHKCGQVLT